MMFDLQPHLLGDLVELRPATADDFDALYTVASDPKVWELHPAHDRWQEPVFRNMFEQGLASGGMLVAIQRASGAVIGSSRYHFARTEEGEITIGWTFLARQYWGGRYNGEIKQLMLDHAFTGFARVIFLIGEGNARSRRAVEKVGATLTDRHHAAITAGKLTAHVVYALDRPSAPGRAANAAAHRRNCNLIPPALRPAGMPQARRPLAQKTVGILGGMSNQATAEYYRMINERLNAELGGWDNGEIVIVSVNFGNVQHFVREGLWQDAAIYVDEKIGRLEAAGVDVIACASNTMHRVVEPSMRSRSTPFIHVADPTGEAIRIAGLRRVGLLGTMPVMQSSELRQRYAEKFGIEIIVPIDADKGIIDRVIFDELVRGQFKPTSKQEYLRIIKVLRSEGAEGVILGCTEIFLLLDQSDLADFPVFDTTSLHVQALVDFVLDEDFASTHILGNGLAQS